MIMKRILVVCSFLLMFFTVFSQETEKLSIEDAVVGLYSKYYPEYISNLQWRPNSEYFTFTEENSLKQQGPGAKSSEIILELDSLNSALVNFGAEEFKNFPRISWMDVSNMKFRKGNSEYIYNFKAKSIVGEIKFPDSAENFDFNPKKPICAFTQGNNLRLVDNTGNYTDITNERDLNVSFGNEVHRREFGIEKGTFWSTDGNKLAFYGNNEGPVSEYPLVDITQRSALPKMIPYPMAGMSSEEVQVMVYDIESGETITLDAKETKDRYFTNISWSPDEKYIYIAELNRDQDHMEFKCYNAINGKFVKTLFEEKHEKYVEPQHPAVFIPNTTDKFIWQSRRDGYNHLYLYNTKGEMLKQLTSGKYEVTELIKISPDGNKIFIQANKETAIDFDIYCIDINSVEMTRISKEPGTHNALISDDCNFIIDSYSSIKVPRRYVVYDMQGKELAVLLDSKNPLEEKEMPECVIGTIKAADGTTDLYYRLIKPEKIEKKKKYPAIIYVYGGPHAQLITNSWLAGAQGWLYYMAQEGYIMLTIDNRGSANRGMEFESIIHREAGKQEMADQMEGIKLLESLGYVDMDRVGVHGWSYGGFMTISLMLEHNDIFKVGCAGGPVIDWKFYEVMYGERYMDTPEQNPKGYESTSLLNKADKLTGRLLIVHGAQDPVVVWQHSQAFLQACIEAGTLPDYFVYPTHEHNVRGYDRIHLMRMVTRYFKDHL
jgi:dipeptidyl-peptidase 4